MTLKVKIVERFKAKYPKVNLSQKRIDAIADKLKVTDETEIDAALDAANDLLDFADLAKEEDKLRTAEAKLKAPKPDPIKPDPANPNPDPQTPETDITKIISAAISPLMEKITKLESGNTQKTRETIAQEKFKDLNPDFVASTLADLPLMNFENDEAYNSYIERKVTEGTKLTQTVANDALGNQSRPIIANGKVEKTASAKELDDVMSNIKI